MLTLSEVQSVHVQRITACARLPWVHHCPLDSFDDTTLTTFRCPEKIWKRYADDTFILLSKYVARSFLVYVNNINEAIQFIVERENENGEIPFLDCLIKRNAGENQDTIVHKNPANIGRYLTVHFRHSSATKQGLIMGLYLRAVRVCSTPVCLRTEMEMFIDSVKKRLRN